MAQQLLSKNMILAGIIDHFCLVCQQLLQGPSDLARHMANCNHRAALHSVQRVEEFTDDGISKVPYGYFCEYCNVFILSDRHLENHLESEYHQRNKLVEQQTNARQLKWGILLSDNLFFTHKSWQGMHDKFCVICKVRFENIVNHANHPVHKLNLILKRVQVNDEDNYYRRVDEAHILCISCSLVIKQSDMAAHFGSYAHLDHLDDWYEAANQLLEAEVIVEKQYSNQLTKFQPHNPSLRR